MNQAKKREMTALKRTEVLAEDTLAYDLELVAFKAAAFVGQNKVAPRNDFDAMRADIRRRYAKTLARLGE